jgi:hypothetical protein
MKKTATKTKAKPAKTEPAKSAPAPKTQPNASPLDPLHSLLRGAYAHRACR